MAVRRLTFRLRRGDRRGNSNTPMKYRLFIIEGDPKTGERYLEALRKSDDFEPELFATTEEANAVAEKRTTNLVLADIRLDEAVRNKAADATDFLAKIRAGKTYFDRRVPVVLFTRDFARLNKRACQRAVKLGATDLLAKDDDITPETAAKVLLRILDRIHEDDHVIRALKLIRAQSDRQTLVVVPVAGGEEEEVSLDAVIRHMELDDDFARNFRAGLDAVAITLLQGGKRTKK